MFLGHYRHAVDAKGRVALPASFRKALSVGSVITIGSEGRLVIRPAAEWSAFEADLRLRQETPREERQFLRFVFANAREVEIDSQGRILLTPDQRAFAAIADRAVFAGVGNVVEVVGEEAWDRDMASFTPDAFTRLSDSVFSEKGGPSSP